MLEHVFGLYSGSLRRSLVEALVGRLWAAVHKSTILWKVRNVEVAFDAEGNGAA